MFISQIASLVAGILFWNTIVHFSGFGLSFFLGILYLSLYGFVVYKKRKEIDFNFIAFSFLGSFILAEYIRSRILVLGGLNETFFKIRNPLFFLYFLLASISLLILQKKQKNWKSSFQKFLSYTPFLLQCLFMFYLHNPTNLTSLDTKFARLVPYSIVLERNLDLNEFFGNPKIVKIRQPRPPEVIEKINEEEAYIYEYFLIRVGEKFYTLYPLVLGVLSSLLYFLFWVLGFPVFQNLSPTQFPLLIQDTGEAFAMERISAAFVAILTSFVFFKISRKFVHLIPALLITLIYSIATSHYTISSQALWQHGFVEFLFLLIYYLVIKIRKKNSNLLYGIWIGFFAALAFFVRGTSALLLLLIGLEFLFYIYRSKNYKLIAYTIVGALPIMISLIMLNLSIYSNPMGGYGVFFSKPENSLFFSNSYIFQNLYHILFSASRGLFIYFPYFLVLLILGIYYRKNFRIWILIGTILSYIFFFTRYYDWHGGWNYGPRMLTETMPAFLLLLVLLWKKINSMGRFFKSVFFFLISFSIFAQLQGTYAEQSVFSRWHSCTLYDFRDHIDDWENTQILANLRLHFSKLISGFPYKGVYSCSKGTPIREGSRIQGALLDSKNPIDLLYPSFFLPEKAKNLPLLLTDEFYASTGKNCLEISLKQEAKESELAIFLVVKQTILEIPIDKDKKNIRFEFSTRSNTLNSLLVFGKTNEPIQWDLFRVWKNSCPN
jgi:hypothetical protein